MGAPFREGGEHLAPAAAEVEDEAAGPDVEQFELALLDLGDAAAEEVVEALARVGQEVLLGVHRARDRVLGAALAHRSCTGLTDASSTISFTASVARRTPSLMPRSCG